MICIYRKKALKFFCGDDKLITTAKVTVKNAGSNDKDEYVATSLIGSGISDNSFETDLTFSNLLPSGDSADKFSSDPAYLYFKMPFVYYLFYYNSFTSKLNVIHDKVEIDLGGGRDYSIPYEKWEEINYEFPFAYFPSEPADTYKNIWSNWIKKRYGYDGNGGSGLPNIIAQCLIDTFQSPYNLVLNCTLPLNMALPSMVGNQYRIDLASFFKYDIFPKIVGEHCFSNSAYLISVEADILNFKSKCKFFIRSR